MEERNEEWVERAEAGWTLVQLPHLALDKSFLLGDEQGRLTIRYFRKDDDNLLRAKVLFGMGVQGPPGHAHGGSVAAVLDECMGGAAWLAGHPVLVAELTVRFKRMVPLESRCVLESRLLEIEGRKVRASGVLMDEAGNTYASAEGLFIELERKQLEAFRDAAEPIIEALRKAPRNLTDE